jgi:hypothetical protein
MILARDDPSRARQELEFILKQNPQNRAVQRALERLRQGP